MAHTLSTKWKVAIFYCVKHHIDVGNVRLVAYPARKMPIRWREKAEEHVQKLIDIGAIYPCPGAQWVSPPVYTDKPNGSLRYAIDLRFVNAATVKE